jgi:4-hydroxy-2-oxoheptanedioate aldolase
MSPLDGSQPNVHFGGFVGLPSLVSVEIFVHAGFDFVVLDLQHGTLSSEFALNAIQLLDVLGVESLLRLTTEQLPLVTNLLDFGANGLILASVDDAHMVESAMKLARYQPGGTRSYGQQRKGLKVEPADVHMVQPNVFAMIETRPGLDNVESIASVPGLSGLVIGPSDLALALGLGPGEGPADPCWRAAIDAVRLAATRHAISAYMVANDGEHADVHLFTRVHAELARARALGAPQ